MKAVNIYNEGRRPDVKSFEEIMNLKKVDLMLKTLCTLENFRKGKIKFIVENWFLKEMGFDIHNEYTVTEFDSMQRYSSMDLQALIVIKGYKGEYIPYYEEPCTQVMSSIERIKRRTELRAIKKPKKPEELNVGQFRKIFRTTLLALLDNPSNDNETWFYEELQRTKNPEDFLLVVFEQYKLAYIAKYVCDYIKANSVVKLPGSERLALSPLLKLVDNLTPMTFEYLETATSTIFGQTVDATGIRQEVMKQLATKCDSFLDFHLKISEKTGHDYMAVFKNYSIAQNWIECASYLFQDKNITELERKMFTEQRTFEEFYLHESQLCHGSDFLEDLSGFIESGRARFYSNEKVDSVSSVREDIPESLKKKVQELTEGCFTVRKLTYLEITFMELTKSSDSLVLQAKQWFNPKTASLHKDSDIKNVTSNDNEVVSPEKISDSVSDLTANLGTISLKDQNKNEPINEASGSHKNVSEPSNDISEPSNNVSEPSKIASESPYDFKMDFAVLPTSDLPLTDVSYKISEEVKEGTFILEKFSLHTLFKGPYHATGYLSDIIPGSLKRTIPMKVHYKGNAYICRYAGSVELYKSSEYEFVLHDVYYVPGIDGLFISQDCLDDDKRLCSHPMKSLALPLNIYGMPTRKNKRIRWFYCCQISGINYICFARSFLGSSDDCLPDDLRFKFDNSYDYTFYMNNKIDARFDPLFRVLDTKLDCSDILEAKYANYVGEIITVTVEEDMPLSHMQNSCLLLFYDHFSNGIWAVAISSISEVGKTTVGMLQWINDTYSVRGTRMLHTIGRRFLKSNMLKKYLKQNFIIHYEKAVLSNLRFGTIQVTFYDLLRAMQDIHETRNLPANLWDFCAEYCAYFLNHTKARVFVRSGEKILPSDLLLGENLRLKKLSFGCDSKVNLTGMANAWGFNATEKEQGVDMIYLGGGPTWRVDYYYLMMGRRVFQTTKGTISDNEFVQIKRMTRNYYLNGDDQWIKLLSVIEDHADEYAG